MPCENDKPEEMAREREFKSVLLAEERGENG